MGDFTPEIKIFEFGGVEIDVSRNRLTVDGEERHLRQKPFQVLVYLVTNRQRVVSKAELFGSIWPDTAVTDDVLVQCVKEIRRALKDDRRDPRFIKTIYKSGYRFVWEFEELSSFAPESGIAELPVPPASPVYRAPRFFAAGVAAAILIIACSIVYFAWPFNARVADVRLPVIEGRKSIAVMFFDNQSKNSEFEWLREGLADMLIAGLSRSEDLTVLSRDQLFSLVERHYDKNDPISLERAKDLAGKSQAAYFTVGGFSQIGGAIRLDINLYETESGRLISSESLFVDRAEQLLTQIDVLAIKISTRLDAATGQNNGVMGVMTDNLEAYRYYSLGVEKAQAFHNLEAIELFEKAIKLDPYFAMAQARIGYTYAVSSGEVEKGKPYLEKAYQLGARLTEKDRLSIAAWYAIANLDFAAAIRSYRQLIDRFPLETESYFRLARLLRGEDKADQAIDVLRRGLAIDPDDKNMHNALGTILSGKGRHDEAIAEHERYVALAPDEPNAIDSLGLSYQAAGNYQKAIENYERAIRLNQKFEIAIVHLANTRFRLGQYKKAIEAFDNYVAAAPSNAEKTRGYEGIAYIYLSKGDLDMAERFNAKAEQANGGPSWTSYLILVKRGKSEKARSLEMLLISKIQPVERGARANRRLDWYYRAMAAMRNGAVAEAFDYYKQTLAFPPPTWHWLDFEDCLGLAYLDAGRYDEAIAEFQRILNANPNYPLAHYHLARALLAKGELDAAKANYKKFLDVWKDADADIPEIKAAVAALQ